jgi:hypothetical protein
MEIARDREDARVVSPSPLIGLIMRERVCNTMRVFTVIIPIKEILPFVSN